MQRMKRKEKIALLHTVRNKFMKGIDVDTHMLFKQRLDQVTYYIYLESFNATYISHSFSVFFFSLGGVTKKLFLKTVTIAKAKTPVQVQCTTLQNIKVRRTPYMHSS